ncbi:MAG: alpha/beta hydrolase [Planctomycetes bacterium]|nr:alpha/beta hydrolase [Planctomycetota bacterium]MCH9725123.1 alpha/beta hydrolase [Planctomycetota bacterium]MCH9774915.1 alpha/beta hydrolase [Planctomycetota bacterium]MCH9791783.1 alpha/beta hydrolase [Planctomycetota bacterium]
MFLKHSIQIAVFSAVAIIAGSLNAQQPRANRDDRLKEILKRYPKADTNGDGVLSREEAVTFNQKRLKRLDEQKKRNKPTTPSHANVQYGDHKQQAFDLWLAKSKEKGSLTPLCIYIHGGGFRGGDKGGIRKSIVERFLNEGISFASINYRLTNGGEFPYPIAMHDSARCLQLIRSRAAEWNIDSKKIVCYGGSAGAGISLWLAFNDDRADANSDDPVARQSTRILAAGTLGGQSTYDMRVFRKWFGVPDLPPHSALVDFYAMQESETVDTPRVVKLAEEASAITHLTRDDPPVYMSYNRPNSKVTIETNQSIWVHHPLLGLKLQEAMRKLNIECIVKAPDIEDDSYEDLYDFLIKKLTKKEG